MQNNRYNYNDDSTWSRRPRKKDPATDESGSNSKIKGFDTFKGRASLIIMALISIISIFMALSCKNNRCGVGSEESGFDKFIAFFVGGCEPTDEQYEELVTGSGTSIMLSILLAYSFGVLFYNYKNPNFGDLKDGSPNLRTGMLVAQFIINWITTSRAIECYVDMEDDEDDKDDEEDEGKSWSIIFLRILMGVNVFLLGYQAGTTKFFTK